MGRDQSQVRRVCWKGRFARHDRIKITESRQLNQDNRIEMAASRWPALLGCVRSHRGEEMSLREAERNQTDTSQPCPPPPVGNDDESQVTTVDRSW